MALLGKKNRFSHFSTQTSSPQDSPELAANAEEFSSDNTKHHVSAHAKKGRPTPKRHEAQKKKNIYHGAPPMTKAEARRRKKALQPQTKAEKRALAAERKAGQASRRARMLAGDESVLPAKDKGPIRRYARSVIDSRKAISNYFLPVMFLCLLASLVLTSNPQITPYLSPITMAILVIFIIDAAIAGYLVVRQTRKKFPQESFNARSLAFYGFVRSTQLPKMRMPAPEGSRSSPSSEQK